MKKIKYIKQGNNEICAYFDKSIFNSENHEKNCLVTILQQILKVYMFEGTVIVNYKDNDTVEQLKKFSLKYEERATNKGVFRKNIVLIISFESKVLKELIDILYCSDITFEGQAFQREGSKLGILLNDHDGSCIILNNNSRNLDYYKNKFLNEINKQN